MQGDLSMGFVGWAGTFHSNLPRIVQTLRFSLLHKDKRTFADASEMKADW